jgi:serine/threonine protein kinase
MVMELLPMSDLYQILYPKEPPASSDELDGSLKIQKYEKLKTWHSQLVSNLELRIRIGLDIAEGMKYLHSLSPPIIHRDLRSPNIFVSFLFYYY